MTGMTGMAAARRPGRVGWAAGLLSLTTAAASAAAGEPVALFNGLDLDGFTTWLRDTGREDPRGVFSVEGGALRISGDGYGYLATEREFGDYVLTLEFRWGDQEGLDRERLGRGGKALDSGVFLHATGPDGNSHDGEGAYMAAVECNLFEGACGDILLIRGTAADGGLIAPRVTVEAAPGRDADGFPWWRERGDPVTLERWGRVNAFGKSPAWQDRRGFLSPESPEKPPGQWNRLEVRCQDGAVSVTLNGTAVNQVTGVFPNRGRILLQCEGAEVYFRNLVVVEEGG